MGLKREVLQVVFGAGGYALALQYGLIKASNPFLDNLLWGVVVMVGSRFAAYLIGGGKK